MLGIPKDISCGACRDCAMLLSACSREGSKRLIATDLTVTHVLQKKKALRKREEEEPVDLSFLEAEAASAAAGASADHGSRAQRGAIAEAQQAKREQDAAAKQAR